MLSALLYSFFIDELLCDVHASGYGYYLPKPSSGDNFVGALACADDIAAISKDIGTDLPPLIGVIDKFAIRHMQQYGDIKTVLLIFRPNPLIASYPTTEQLQIPMSN